MAQASPDAATTAAVQKIKEYVFEDPDFEGLFKGWAMDNCHHFDLSTPVEEHTLKHTELHQQFTELFNKKLGEQVEDAGVTIEAVFGHLAKEMEGDPMSEDAFLVNILVSITDFTSFVTMMREVAAEVDEEGKQPSA